MVADGFNGETGSIVLYTTVVSLIIWMQKKAGLWFCCYNLDVKSTLYSSQFELLEIKIKSCHR